MFEAKYVEIMIIFLGKIRFTYSKKTQQKEREKCTGEDKTNTESFMFFFFAYCC